MSLPVPPTPIPNAIEQATHLIWSQLLPLAIVGGIIVLALPLLLRAIFKKRATKVQRRAKPAMKHNTRHG